MLPKSNRITTGLFDSIMEKGRVAHSPLFLLRYVISGSETRCAAVAPKKAAHSAAGRNRTRRKIYDAVRSIKDDMSPGATVIILAKPAATRASRAEMISDLKGLFVRSGLLR